MDSPLNIVAEAASATRIAFLNIGGEARKRSLQAAIAAAEALILTAQENLEYLKEYEKTVITP